jgi:tetrahydromethanopterin S-methyltransferase subunit F
LLRGWAAFTEGERWTGGLLGCGALVLVGLRGASTIGLAIGFAF